MRQLNARPSKPRLNFGMCFDRSRGGAKRLHKAPKKKGLEIRNWLRSSESLRVFACEQPSAERESSLFRSEQNKGEDLYEGRSRKGAAIVKRCYTG
jgi:hypothetical protein